LGGGTTYALTGRSIFLNAAANGIDVTGGTLVTLDTAFGFSAATNAFNKNDDGTLAFDAAVNNSALTGTWTITTGALRIAANQNINNVANNLTVTAGAALQLNGASLSKAAGVLSISGSGLNTTGTIRAVAGVNAVTSALTQA